MFIYVDIYDTCIRGRVKYTNKQPPSTLMLKVSVSCLLAADAHDVFPGKRSYRNVPTDRGNILGFRWKVRFDLYLPVKVIFSENTDFQVIVYLIRSIVRSADKNSKLCK